MTPAQLRKNYTMLRAVRDAVVADKNIELFTYKTKGEMEVQINENWKAKAGSAPWKPPAGEKWVPWELKRDKLRLIEAMIDKVRGQLGSKATDGIRLRNHTRVKRVWVSFVQGGAPGLVQQRALRF